MLHFDNLGNSLKLIKTDILTAKNNLLHARLTSTQ